MPRVIGVDIPDNKRLIISLTYIYGVGSHIASDVLSKLALSQDMKARELTEDQIAKLNALLQSEYTVEGDLRRKVKADITRLVTIGSYRGLRHRMGLPVRGQITQKNARTRKGKKKTVAGKKKAV